MTTQCVVCQNNFSEHELVISEHGKVCQSCELDLEAPAGGPPKLVIAAGVCAVAPFLLTFKLNGLVITSLIGGVIAILVSIAAMVTYGKSKQMQWVAAGGVALLIGIVHVLRAGLF